MTETTPTPSTETITWTTQLAGCDEAVHRGQRLGWCITHGMKKRTPWPCPVAVDLAAKIAARDARRDAEKSALIRVVHDDVDTQRAQTPFLDEFVARGVNVHFEAMSNAQFWIGVDFDDGTKWSINCGAVNPNAKGYAFAEQDSP